MPSCSNSRVPGAMPGGVSTLRPVETNRASGRAVWGRAGLEGLASFGAGCLEVLERPELVRTPSLVMFCSMDAIVLPRETEVKSYPITYRKYRWNDDGLIRPGECQGEFEFCRIHLSAEIRFRQTHSAGHGPRFYMGLFMFIPKE